MIFLPVIRFLYFPVAFFLHDLPRTPRENLSSCVLGSMFGRGHSSRTWALAESCFAQRPSRSPATDRCQGPRRFPFSCVFAWVLSRVLLPFPPRCTISAHSQQRFFSGWPLWQCVSYNIFSSMRVGNVGDNMTDFRVCRKISKSSSTSPFQFDTSFVLVVILEIRSFQAFEFVFLLRVEKELCHFC